MGLGLVGFGGAGFGSAGQGRVRFGMAGTFDYVQTTISAQPADVLALAALGRMFLAMQRQERLPLPAREVEVLESRKEIASQ